MVSPLFFSKPLFSSLNHGTKKAAVKAKKAVAGDNRRVGNCMDVAKVPNNGILATISQGKYRVLSISEIKLMAIPACMIAS